MINLGVSNCRCHGQNGEVVDSTYELSILMKAPPPAQTKTTTTRTNRIAFPLKILKKSAKKCNHPGENG